MPRPSIAIRLVSGQFRSRSASGRAFAVDRTVACVLAAIVALGFGLRAHHALSPNLRHHSADENAYVAIAQALHEGGTYGGSSDNVLHWPPGAPLLFAAAQHINDSDITHGDEPDIPSAYWAQAIVGTATILAVFAIVALVAAPRPALVAAAATACYPPLVAVTGELLSEPLGACTLASAMLATLWATTAPTLRRHALAGTLLGAAILARADFLLLPLALGALLVCGQRTIAIRRRALHALVMVAAAGLTVLPWATYVSIRAGHVVPVTTGDGPALFIGTFLPGDGTLLGTKRVLGPRIRRHTRHAAFKHLPSSKLPAGAVFNYVADRHPSLDDVSALRAEGLRNLRDDLSHPRAYAAMTARKLDRMWLHPSRVGSASKPRWVAVAHVLVLVASLTGILAGLLLAPSLRLAIIVTPVLYATALHAFLVAQPRYNLPLIAPLIAGGVIGATQAYRARQHAPARTPTLTSLPAATTP